MLWGLDLEQTLIGLGENKMARIKYDATFEDFEETINKAYTRNNRVYKVTVILDTDASSGENMKYVFETPKGPSIRQTHRVGTIDEIFE